MWNLTQYYYFYIISFFALIWNLDLTLTLPRPQSCFGGQHHTPVFPETFAPSQWGADLSDNKWQDQWRGFEHTLLPQALDTNTHRLTPGDQQAARPGTPAQEVSWILNQFW